MAKTGGTPTARFKIWGAVKDTEDRRTLAHTNPEIDKWRSRVIDHPVGCNTEKQVTKMTKFSRRRVSKERPAAENPKKTPENMKIPAETPKAPLKPRRAAKKLNGVPNVPKRLEFPEAEDENAESIDTGFVASQSRVNHRYSTRARVSARSRQNHEENQPKSSNARPTIKTKRNKNLPDFDKENDGSAANGAEQRQGTSSNKKRSGLPVNRLGSQNLAIPEDLNFTGKQLLECPNTDGIEHMRWLQQQRDIGLWIECTRKGCGKWRYVEEYHDPLDVPKEWVCKMNTDARFANCAVPEADILEAETANQIENAFNAGSIVWAKINGYPWWPAMVDDCPRLFRYFEIRASSIVPYKYHVKFFNEMKIAWILLRDIKPYAENPRSTFLKRKKIVFGPKDYTEELDAACEVTDQALPLSLHQRFEKFSWAAQCFGDLPEVERDRNTAEIPPKKNKLAKTSINDRKKRRAKKNVTRITNKTVPRGKTINVRSRIVNVETDSAVNRETCEKKNATGSCEDRNPTSRCEKRKCTASANSEPCTKKRVYNIGNKTFQKSELEAMSTRDFRNLICGFQDPSLRLSRSDGSEIHTVACTVELSASTREPILVDLTDSDNFGWPARDDLIEEIIIDD